MTARLYRDGGRVVVRFALPSEVAEVGTSVVGSFNGWVPGINMLEPRDGSALSSVAEVDHAGDVHFRYLAPGGRWFDDDDADLVDEYGSTLRHPADDLDLPALDEGAVVAAEQTKAPITKASTTKPPAKKASTSRALSKKAPSKKSPAQKAPER